MKALSLTQPWATLVAIGAKRIETRSWETLYRGPLAIQAAKAFPLWARRLCAEHPFVDALAGWALERLPLGAVICTVRLADCRRIDTSGGNTMRPPAEPELSFGDYTPGRFAWIFEDVRALPGPIPARGALNLWEWESPEAAA